MINLSGRTFLERWDLAKVGKPYKIKSIQYDST